VIKVPVTLEAVPTFSLPAHAIGLPEAAPLQPAPVNTAGQQAS
jgi:hypothetical protein